MGNRPLSSLPPEGRFWANVAIMAIITTILIFAGIVWILIQQKVQISHTISNQQTETNAVPSNTGNIADLLVKLDATNNASTNMLAPLMPPVVSVTSSN